MKSNFDSRIYPSACGPSSNEHGLLGVLETRQSSLLPVCHSSPERAVVACHSPCRLGRPQYPRGRRGLSEGQRFE